MGGNSLLHRFVDSAHNASIVCNDAWPSGVSCGLLIFYFRSVYRPTVRGRQTAIFFLQFKYFFSFWRLYNGTATVLRGKKIFIILIKLTLEL